MNKRRYRPSTQWRETYPQGKAPLSWLPSDYDAWQIERPAELGPNQTEGELMGEAEVEAWLKDSIATIRIFFETEPKRGEELYRDFILDVRYLNRLEKVTDDVVDFALDEGNFKWYDQGHGQQAK